MAAEIFVSARILRKTCDLFLASYVENITYTIDVKGYCTTVTKIRTFEYIGSRASLCGMARELASCKWSIMYRKKTPLQCVEYILFKLKW